jgi:hypothetical protein
MGVEEARARFLVDLIGKCAQSDSRILEVGSREGANLISLWRAGFTGLRGIESDELKVSTFRKNHPDIAEHIDVTAGSIEELVRGLGDASFDLVFTVGFLFDRQGDYSWLPPQLARITARYMVSIEYERDFSLKDTCESAGLREIEAMDLSVVEGLDSVFFARVFEKVSSS